jgi:nucleotide-binding universal stress UspA family protein
LRAVRGRFTLITVSISAAGEATMSGIVVGVDRSEHALHALRWALEEAAHRRCSVRVVHVWEPHYVYEDCRGDLAMAMDEECGRRAAKLADELVEDALEGRNRPAGLETLTRQGKPSKVLINLSADADLLVVGALGRGAFRHLLTGSVAQQVVNHARCPVAIVPSLAVTVSAGAGRSASSGSA